MNELMRLWVAHPRVVALVSLCAMLVLAGCQNDGGGGNGGDGPY